VEFRSSTPTGTTWSGHITGQEVTSLYREVLGTRLYQRCGIPVQTHYLTKIPPQTDALTTFFAEKYRLCLVSEKWRKGKEEEAKTFKDVLEMLRKEEYEVLVDARVSARGSPSSDSFIRVNGFWKLLAVSKWLGDIDLWGPYGLEAGVLNQPDGVSVAKFSASFFGLEFERENEFINKHLQLSPNPRDLYNFNLLKKPAKFHFLEQIGEILLYSESTIKEMCEIKNNYVDVHGKDSKMPEEIEGLAEWAEKWPEKLIVSQKRLSEMYKQDLEDMYIDLEQGRKSGLGPTDQDKDWYVTYI